jgi:hypothetical protein
MTPLRLSPQTGASVSHFFPDDVPLLTTSTASPTGPTCTADFCRPLLLGAGGMLQQLPR